jgi:hypothetical protein
MQQSVLPLSDRIADLCNEKTRIQREIHEYRHCPRDWRHDKWETELKEINEKRLELVRQQKLSLKKCKQPKPHGNNVHFTENGGNQD